MARDPVNEVDAPPERLFAEFSAPSSDAWRAAAVASLKGAAFEKLLTRTYEGIELQPIYRHEDAAGLSHQHTLPGAPPYVRAAEPDGYLVDGWLVAQETAYAAPAAANAALRHDLAHGQTAVNLRLDSAVQRGADVMQPAQDGLFLVDADDLVTTLAGVDLVATPLRLQSGVAGLAVSALLAASVGRRGEEIAVLNGVIEFDPLGVLALHGALPVPLEALYTEMAQLAAWAETHAPRLATIGVDPARYNDSGANAVQELAYALATGVAYIRATTDRGLSVDTACRAMSFTFAVGANFFMEVAKLRAARLLWSRVVAAFGGSDEAQKLRLHARSARWNKSALDPYVNMLRVTTETFAGALGGVQSMDVAPFDSCLRQPEEFSRRIARNTQLILQQECHLTHVVDPAGGSWYVEWLTDQLAQRAWQLFQQIEAEGGMAAALQNGTVQTQVEAVAAQRRANLAKRKDVLVGVNMYPTGNEEHPQATAAPLSPHLAEGRNDDLLVLLAQSASADRIARAVDAAAAGASLADLTRAMRAGMAPGEQVAPLPQGRAAHLFEALRSAADGYTVATGVRPRVFLANLGPLAQHKARADFSRGFFEVGGFVIDDTPGFATAQEAADAALAAGARAVVICSTDESYPELVPPLVGRIKASRPETVVILAGYPQAQVEAHRAAGVDEFIHVRADCGAINGWLQKKMGIA